MSGEDKKMNEINENDLENVNGGFGISDLKNLIINLNDYVDDAVVNTTTAYCQNCGCTRVFKTYSGLRATCMTCNTTQNI